MNGEELRERHCECGFENLVVFDGRVLREGGDLRESVVVRFVWMRGAGVRVLLIPRYCEKPEQSHHGHLAIPFGEQRRIWWITSF